MIDVKKINFASRQIEEFKMNVICKNVAFPIKNIEDPFTNEVKNFLVRGDLRGNRRGLYFLFSNGVPVNLTKEGVQDFLKHHDYEKYVELFGELEEA